jgi:drug/metabolite transporter (DMT)-like permease
MRPAQPALGVALIVGSVFLMLFGDALIKYNSATFTAWQIFVLRSVVTVPIPLALMLMLAPRAPLRPRSLRWVGLRSLLMVLMWIAYYAALPLISLSAAAVAFYTAPLFITLLARSLTREPVGPAKWLGVVLGFVGVLVVLRPGGDTFSLTALLPVLAAFLYALAAIITRTKCAGERPLMLALGLNVGLFAAGLVATAALALHPPAEAAVVGHPFGFDHWAIMGLCEWSLMAFLALLMVLLATGVAMAYQIAPAALIGTFDYTYVIFAVLWGYVLFAERPDATAMAGLALIGAAGLLVAGRPVAAAQPATRGSADGEGEA